MRDCFLQALLKRQVFDPTGSPFERGEGSKEDPLTFRLALNEG